MSCFAESIYSVYTDGELSAQESREVEMHLVGCRECRALVLALREEASLLNEVLQERERPAAALRPAAAPARGLALGMLPALAGVGAVVFVLGWLIETGLPSSIEWLNPFRLMGAFSMAFDLIFTLRDRVPELFDFALSVAATVSVAALLTFAVSVLTRRWTGPVAVAALGLAMAAHPTPSAALRLEHHHDSYQVAAGETLADSLAISGESVRIDGVIEGDVFVLARKLTVRGEIRGNLFACVRSLEISGEVRGSTYTFSEDVRARGRVRGSAYYISRDFTLEEEGRIGRDLIFLGEIFELRGRVGRNLFGKVGHLSLLETARIDGDLRVRLLDSEKIEIASGAVVGGEIDTQPIGGYWGRRGPWYGRYMRGHYYLWLGIELGAAFLFGLALYGLAPRIFEARLDTGGAFFRSLGVGFLAAVGAPIALVLAAVTVVGIPLAIAGLFVLLAGLYTAGLVVAAIVGNALVHPRGEGWRAFGWTLLAGLLALLVVCHLPIVGGLIAVIVILTGLGLLAQRGYAAYESR